MKRIGDRKRNTGKYRRFPLTFRKLWASVVKSNSSNKTVLRLHENESVLLKSNQFKKIWPL